MNDSVPTVVTHLRNIRTAASETQEQLAEAVGATRQTIIAIEKGNYTPSVRLALQIARHFNKQVEDIFAYE